jgi:hypothetical protein
MRAWPGACGDAELEFANRRNRSHIQSMDSIHPHDGATYRIVQQADMSFGVEVSIPGTHPTTVTGFATEADARAWAAKHKEGVARGDPLQRRRTYARKPAAPG